jgi:vacuolar protein sorting-associated protein 35
MQRALKIASVSNPNLYVDLLDRYLFYYENENPVITVNYITGLIRLINETFSADSSAILPATQAHYRNTLGKLKISTPFTPTQNMYDFQSLHSVYSQPPRV